MDFAEATVHMNKDSVCVRADLGTFVQGERFAGVMVELPTYTMACERCVLSLELVASFLKEAV